MVRVCLIVIAILMLAGCTMAPPQEVIAETIGTVDQTSSVITNTGMDFKTLLVFVLLAGWAIPSPSEMFGWICKAFFFIKWW